MLTRREAMAGASALAVGAGFGAIPSFAQTVESLRIFVPAAPGGGWDQTARSMENALRGTQLIKTAQITNVGGAGGAVGLPQFINQWKGQGNSLMVAGLVMVGSLIANKSQFNLAQVTPIARLTGEYQALVVPAGSPFKTAKQLVDALKADPGKVPVAGGSAGGTDHILIGMIAQAVGVPAAKVSYVAFAGGGPATAAILGSQVAAGVSGYGEFSEVDPAFDLVSAGVEFLAGLAVEGVEGGVGGGGDSHFAGIAEP